MTDWQENFPRWCLSLVPLWELHKGNHLLKLVYIQEFHILHLYVNFTSKKKNPVNKYWTIYSYDQKLKYLGEHTLIL